MYEVFEFECVSWNHFRLCACYTHTERKRHTAHQLRYMYDTKLKIRKSETSNIEAKKLQMIRIGIHVSDVFGRVACDNQVLADSTGSRATMNCVLISAENKVVGRRGDSLGKSEEKSVTRFGLHVFEKQ